MYMRTGSVVRPTLGIQRRQRGGGFLGGGVVDLAAAGGLAGQQTGSRLSGATSS
jgi:hypothetical protein